jgi:hypothetical protein
MAMVSSMTVDRARQEAAAMLRLPADADPLTIAAESIRRAASVRCPSTPLGLVEAVYQVIEPLFSLTKDDVAEVLDAVVAAGDLVEATDESGGQRRRLLYLGPPRYVQRGSGDLLLLGVRPDGAPLVGEGLADRVHAVRHLRRLNAPTKGDLDLVSLYGLTPISEGRWTGHEAVRSAAEVTETYVRLLNRQGPSGEIPGLRILDPSRPPNYYRGRWRPADPSDSGLFVARRSQGYGADLWCFVELHDGSHRRLLDLPAVGRDRGCDEAWTLQAALDAERGVPQEVLIRPTGAGRVRLGLPSPPPQWLQRRWDLLGAPAPVRFALFGYEFSASDTRDELAFVSDHLWMSSRVITEDTGP